MKRLKYALIIMLSSAPLLQVRAQLLPANQPEQDACQALRMCGPSMHIPYSYQREGRKPDLQVTPCGSGEGNSMWIQLDIVAAGTIVFTITPVDPLDDYDFAIAQFNSKPCDSLLPSDVVRCNFNNNLTTNPGYIGPVVGLDHISTAPFVNSGFTGGNFLKAIDAQVGDRYLLMINNFGYSGAPASGFTIDFTGSTARFATDGPPVYDSVPKVCGRADTLHVWLSGNVLCRSVATDGSDFRLFPPAASVLSARGINCNNADGYTRHILLTLDRPLPSGSYRLQAQKGTDANTLLGLCGEEQPEDDSITVQVTNPQLDLGNDTVTCIGHEMQLRAMVSGTNGAYGIQWQPGLYLDRDTVTDPVFTAVRDMLYTVTVRPEANPACAVTDSLRITVLQGFDLLTRDTVICIGDTLQVAASGDSRYSYSWTPGQWISDAAVITPRVAPQERTVYTLTGSYPGCRDSVRSVTVDVDPSRALSLFSFGIDSVLCAGMPVLFTPQADSFVRYISWDYGDGTGEARQNPSRGQSHVYPTAGDYTVSITAGFRACPDSVYKQDISISPLPALDLGRDTVICPGTDPVTLRNVFGRETGESYLWNTGDTKASLQVSQPGIYSLTLLSAAGCKSSDEISIGKGCYLDIPNVFTPDGDGLNDYFLPGNALIQGAVRFNAKVYNRWGQQVYMSSDPAGPGWDGRYNGTPVQAGVYVYLVEVVFLNGERVPYQGNITLMR